MPSPPSGAHPLPDEGRSDAPTLLPHPSEQTQAKWQRVSKLTNEDFKARFWVGSTFDGREWTANTGCPATYSWTNGTPGIPVAGSCLSSALRVFGTESSDVQGIWLDGVTPTACDRTDELFAVCEIR